MRRRLYSVEQKRRIEKNVFRVWLFRFDICGIYENHKRETRMKLSKVVLDMLFTTKQYRYIHCKSKRDVWLRLRRKDLVL